MKEPNSSILGSSATMAATRCCSCHHGVEGNVLAGLGGAVEACPVSWLGMNPLGVITSR